MCDLLEVRCFLQGSLSERSENGLPKINALLKIMTSFSCPIKS